MEGNGQLPDDINRALSNLHITVTVSNGNNERSRSTSNVQVSSVEVVPRTHHFSGPRLTLRDITGPTSFRSEEQAAPRLCVSSSMNEEQAVPRTCESLTRGEEQVVPRTSIRYYAAPISSWRVISWREIELEEVERNSHDSSVSATDYLRRRVLRNRNSITSTPPNSDAEEELHEDGGASEENARPY